jgi:hypothetical protein
MRVSSVLLTVAVVLAVAIRPGLAVYAVIGLGIAAAMEFYERRRS